MKILSPALLVHPLNWIFVAAVLAFVLLAAFHFQTQMKSAKQE